ncbi:unnamed protein product, partial [Urochloa humidicola]
SSHPEEAKRRSLQQRGHGAEMGTARVIGLCLASTAISIAAGGETSGGPSYQTFVALALICLAFHGGVALATRSVRAGRP